jgi:hypothetical protein
VAESRTPGADWTFKPNVAWVRWPLADGRHAAVGLRRHLDWVTGEVALSRTDQPVEALPLLAEARFDDDQAPDGARVRLGVLLHDEDRWWPAGETERDLAEILGWIALQLRVKSERLLQRRGAPNPQ